LLGNGRTVRTVPDLEVLAVTSPAEPEKSLNAIDGSAFISQIPVKVILRAKIHNR
jgi:hypothetical protein